MATVARVLMTNRASETATVVAEHGDFVWKTLQRFSVPASDLEDVFQEVFIVVHRRLDSFDGTSRMTTWLYGICRRVVADYRRRAFRRHEEPREEVGAAAISGDDPERSAERSQARRMLERVLNQLKIDQRAVFVMFEIEGMRCAQIADILDVPVGTVHSRLFAARKAFSAALKRLHAEEGKA